QGIGEFPIVITAVLQTDLDPRVLDFHIGDIGPIPGGRLDGIRRGHLQEDVLGYFVEKIHGSRQTVVEQSEIQTDVGLFGDLPLDVGVGQTGENGTVGVILYGAFIPAYGVGVIVVLAVRITELGDLGRNFLVPRPSPTGPELQ